MMKSIKLPMFRANGTRVQLKDLLESIPDNQWSWLVIDYYGTGKAPSGMSMPEFESYLRSCANGFEMSWQELQSFASHLEQTIDCLIVAVDSTEQIDLGRLEETNFRGCHCVLQAFDSTEWRFSASDAELLVKVH